MRVIRDYFLSKNVYFIGDVRDACANLKISFSMYVNFLYFKNIKTSSRPITDIVKMNTSYEVAVSKCVS